MKRILIESPYTPRVVKPSGPCFHTGGYWRRCERGQPTTCGRCAALDEWEAELERNLRYLRAAMRDALMRDEAPFAAHALYTLPGVLDDTVPEERSRGMAAGWLWMEVADGVAVYTDLGISTGMQKGADLALTANLPVEQRNLGPDWDRLHTLLTTTTTGRMRTE